MVLRFFILACLFLFISCSDMKYDNPDDPKSPNYTGNLLSSSVSVKQSTNSAAEHSSSSLYVAQSSSTAAVSSSSSKPSSSSVAKSSSSKPSSSSSIAQSSSSAVESSASELPSSSSVAQSSSSAAVSSSSSKPSSSSSVPPSSSSVAKSSSSAVVSSSSSKPSSSSSLVPSSSSSACTASNNTSMRYCSNGTMKDYGSVTYEGQTYKTVVIGTQTWFQRNLNYNVSGSKCGNGSALSDANTTTCDTYGRLYNWATVMSLDTSCNSSTCSDKINAKHKGICPTGWHIPNNADWNILMKFVNPSCSDNRSCVGAGTKLKATSGWNSYNDNNGGQDTYGFSALPGGFGYSGDGFSYAGNDGNWWSASEYNSGYADFRGMGYSNEYAGYDRIVKSYLFSVRCVQDSARSATASRKASGVSVVAGM